jgi:hypothetical protein
MLIALSMVFVGIGLCAPTNPASAVTGSQFDPGNIIDDSLFYSPAAMSEAEIQAFLDSKIGSCSNGKCLNVLVDSVASRPRVVSDSTGNVRCEAFQGGQLTAAAIIYRVQSACGISAKVILVTLQKEQGLVTKTAPSDAALARAMGYACPDTAPCAPTTLGFGNQVYAGTLQLMTYKASRFGMQPGVRAILWNPASSCGSGTVNVQNYATAALYNYTPYQPNAAALANVYGTGDGCSSYGNRNFWVYYNDWFGSTTGAPPVVLKNTAMGEPDLYGLARDQSGDLWLYSANGTGDWTGAGKVGNGWNSMTMLADVGDFNGDGHRDILARDGRGYLWMYSRDGVGGWLPRVLVGSGWQVFDTIFGAGDFDGDGHQDVLARDRSGYLWLYPGDGLGGWLPRVLVGSGWQVFDTVFGAGDFDGDGRQDVLARDSSGVLWMYPGNGAGDWLPRIQVASQWGSFTSVFSGSDFNGDGYEDLMARDDSGRLWLYAGDGSGKLLPRRQVGSGWDIFSTVLVTQKSVADEQSNPPAHPSDNPAVRNDFTSDGRADTLARSGDGTMLLYPGSGKSDWSPRKEISAGWNGYTVVSNLGDFDGDGNSDVLARDSSGALWLYPGDGKGGWLARTKVGAGWQTFTSMLGAGDFNGDGHPDVLARSSDGGLWLYPGDGKGGWLKYHRIGAGWQVFSTILGVGDFNGDGRQDVLAEGDGLGLLWLYPGDGRGGWLPRVEVGSGWQVFDSILGAGDFNGDGNQDVFARDSAGYLWMYPGNGKGTWLPRVLVGSGWHVFSWIG